MTDLDALGRKREKARAEVARLFEQARVAAIEAVASGVPEADVARRLKVDRMTVRKWLGKR